MLYRLFFRRIKVKILYFLMLMITISCGKKRGTPEERPPVSDDLTLGYLSHTAEVTKVSSAVLTLSCKQPSLVAQEFTVTSLKQNELRLPKGGVGCQIEIKVWC